MDSHFKRKEPKKKKSPLHIGKQKSEASFFIKPCPPVAVPHPQLVYGNIYEAERTVDQVNDWLDRHPDPVTWDKNGNLVPFAAGGVKVQTGLTLARGDMQEYEWSAKSPHNKIYALYHRHLSPRLEADPLVLDRFNDTCERFFRWFASEFDHVFQPTAFDPFEWVESKTDWPRSKRKAYAATIHNQLHGQSFAGSFGGMVKSGETQFGQDLDVRDHFLHGRSDRPRNIFVPCDRLKGYATAIQSLLWDPIKKILPGFVQGLTKDQHTELFRSRVREDMVSISIDGSAFDSTQTEVIRRAVDHRLWSVILPHLERVIEISCERFNFYAITPDVLFQHLSDFVLTDHSLVFNHIGDLKHVRWPEEVWNVWLRDHAKHTRNGYDRYHV